MAALMHIAQLTLVGRMKPLGSFLRKEHYEQQCLYDLKKYSLFPDGLHTAKDW